MLTKPRRPKIEQLSLPLEVPKTATYQLDIEPVSPKIALGKDRYHIVSKRFLGGELVAKYQIPGQWSKIEVVVLHREIKGVLWQLLEDLVFEGRPKDNEEIHSICEAFCWQLRREVQISSDQE